MKIINLKLLKKNKIIQKMNLKRAWNNIKFKAKS